MKTYLLLIKKRIPVLTMLLLFSLTGYSQLTIQMKVFLSGPYDQITGLMNDDLKNNGTIPLVEPYTAIPYNIPAIGEPGGETVTPGVLSIPGTTAIVDWVCIEIRDATTPNLIVSNRRALVRRDGQVVEVDGFSAISFPSTPAGTYHVSIRHRNHLGVMTAIPVMLNAASGLIDFTIGTVWEHPAYPLPNFNRPRRLQGSVYTLWAGDAKKNRNVRYNGTANDTYQLLVALGLATPGNTLTPVYRPEDVNMDNRIRFLGSNNDRLVIRANILGCPENITQTLNFIIREHLP